jgi:hypothetical protein
VNPVHQRMLAYFDYDHLPAHLQQVSGPFAGLAKDLVEGCDRHDYDGAETTVALRKLLEAKDAAVRAAL